MARKSKNKARELMNELKELFLKDGAGLEMIEKGLYQKALANISSFGGSVDKNVEMLAMTKQVIEELDKEI
tara:strand:- start:151 stop:363 length:213 start_codon:yes stop_codon:yes gene_type:complete